jgi:hypothetical protein
MVIGVVHSIVTQTFTNWQSSEVRDIELAMALLYQLGEALPVLIFSCSITYTFGFLSIFSIQ